VPEVSFRPSSRLRLVSLVSISGALTSRRKGSYDIIRRYCLLPSVCLHTDGKRRYL